MAGRESGIEIESRIQETNYIPRSREVLEGIGWIVGFDIAGLCDELVQVHQSAIGVSK